MVGEHASTNLDQAQTRRDRGSERDERTDDLSGPHSRVRQGQDDRFDQPRPVDQQQHVSGQFSDGRESEHRSRTGQQRGCQACECLGSGRLLVVRSWPVQQPPPRNLFVGGCCRGLRCAGCCVFRGFALRWSDDPAEVPPIRRNSNVGVDG